MKAILEKFPKEVLIEFIRENVSLRFKSGRDIEGQLLFIQWGCDTKVAQAEMEAACKAMAAANKETFEDRLDWLAAQKRWQKANKQYDKADRLLEKSNHLRGR